MKKSGTRSATRLIALGGALLLLVGCTSSPGNAAVDTSGTTASASATGTTTPPTTAGTRTTPSTPGATTTAPVTRPDPSALGSRLRASTYSADTTLAAEQALAGSGIATVTGPSSPTPVVPLSGRAAGWTVLDFQAHSLAVDAWSGQGLTGADLDRLLPVPAGIRNQTAPASAFLAGYVAAVDSPGAALSRALMKGQDLTKPASLRFPQLVLVLFTADLATDGGRRAAAATRPSGLRDDGVRGLASPTVCSDVAGFIDQTIANLFNALKVSVPDDTAGAVVASIWNWIVDQGQAFVRSVARAVTSAVLGTIRAIAAGVSAAAEQVMSIVPYAISVRAEPASPVPLGSGRVLVAFTATVSAGDLPQWPAVLQDCAKVAQVPLPSFRGRGAEVSWDPPTTDQPALVTPGTSETVTDENGEARWTFLAGPDPGAAPGADRSARVGIGLTVHRPELDRARAALSDLLFGGLPPLLRDIVGKVFGAVVDPLQQAVNSLIDTRASGETTLAYHDAPPSSRPAPPTTPPSIAGTWHGDWGSTVYPVSGHFSLAFTVGAGGKITGPITISGSSCISTSSVYGLVSGEKITFGGVGSHITFNGTWRGSTMSGSWQGAATSARCPADAGTWSATR